MAELNGKRKIAAAPLNSRKNKNGRNLSGTRDSNKNGENHMHNKTYLDSRNPIKKTRLQLNSKEFAGEMTNAGEKKAGFFPFIFCAAAVISELGKKYSEIETFMQM